MTKNIKDLALALVNATLILVIVALFLTLKVVNKADDLTATFAQNLVQIQPLRDEVVAMSQEIAGLRADLNTVVTGTDTLNGAAAQRLETRATALQTRLDDMQASMAKLSNAPYDIVDHAINSAADATADRVNDIRGCVPPQSIAESS